MGFNILKIISQRIKKRREDDRRKGKNKGKKEIFKHKRVAFNFLNRHPTVMISKNDDGTINSATLTTKAQSKHSKIPLTQNPNRNDKRQSYVQRGRHKYEARTFLRDKEGGQQRRNWSFTKKDWKRVKKAARTNRNNKK